jgi:NAD(P)-dependent dehydrogenase (short-subunit alcohol dehydrogenase family)
MRRADARPKGALVTGAGDRLGRALAISLGQRGFSVAVHYRTSAAGADETVRTIRGHGGKAEAVQADLSDWTAAQALVKRAADCVGTLGVLINSASLFEDDSIETLTEQSWRAHMSANLDAPVALTQAFAAQLPEDATGEIINIVDQRVLRPNPRFFSYTLSKAALFSVTTTLAQALAPRIRVNAIGPGPTMRNIRQSEEDFAKQSAATILGHGAQPDDIVRAASYLLDSEAVTGQMIAVDGGQHLAWRTPDVEGIVE